jgi:hypothetical protein
MASKGLREASGEVYILRNPVREKPVAALERKSGPDRALRLSVRQPVCAPL